MLRTHVLFGSFDLDNLRQAAASGTWLQTLQGHDVQVSEHAAGIFLSSPTISEAQIADTRTVTPSGSLLVLHQLLRPPVEQLTNIHVHRINVRSHHSKATTSALSDALAGLLAEFLASSRLSCTKRCPLPGG